MPPGHKIVEPDQAPDILQQLHQGNAIHLGITKLLAAFKAMY